MAIIKGQMKVYNGTSFDVAHNETAADVVKYSDTTVAAVLGGLASTYVQQDGAKVLSTNDFTDAYKNAINGMSTTYATKSEIASVYKAKGSVANFAALPANADEGDVYNILAAGGTDENGVAIKAGDNVVKTATGWDNLGGIVDLTDYVQKDGLKVLSTNDFTDAYKTKLEGLSAVDTSEFVSIYVGNSAPSDTNVIWFDTSAYV